MSKAKDPLQKIKILKIKLKSTIQKVLMLSMPKTEKSWKMSSKLLRN